MIKTVSRSAAASFVVTVSVMAAGALVGCNPPPAHHANPPHVEGEGHHGHEGHEGHHGHEGKHANPPGPGDDHGHANPPAPTGDGGEASPPDPETGHAHANPPPPAAASDAGLEPAPADWKVTTRDDKTCWARAPFTCPEGARCNPPPPKQVKCPQ